MFFSVITSISMKKIRGKDVLNQDEATEIGKQGSTPSHLDYKIHTLNSYYVF